MSKQVMFSLDKKTIVDELMQAQASYNQALEQENELLARLSKVDLIRLWERLGVVPCQACYHGTTGKLETSCSLFSRCQSFLQAKSAEQRSDGLVIEVSVVFEIV